ncbi:hypothetical protein FKM82_009573 [Ascaphus truei]
MVIAKKGGIIHMVCRNKDRAEEAKNEIIANTGNQNILVHLLDMSNPKEIWEFAEKFTSENKLNVLINNAGCMVSKRELTEDGVEKNFATNTLGLYILTTALLPALEKEEDARVVSALATLQTCVPCIRQCELTRSLPDGTTVQCRPAGRGRFKKCFGFFFYVQRHNLDLQNGRLLISKTTYALKK